VCARGVIRERLTLSDFGLQCTYEILEGPMGVAYPGLETMVASFDRFRNGHASTAAFRSILRVIH
jgi:hypothetical protein